MRDIPGDGQRLRFEILGPVRAWRGTAEVDLGPGKQRAVLARLLVAANRPVPPAQIIDAVWQDDPPENGGNVVQKYIAGLRRVLEPDRPPRTAGQLLTLTEGGYLLSVPYGCLDAEVFRDRVRQAHTLRGEGRPAAAAVELQAALALWRADALAGLSGLVFDAERNRLAESRAAALESWAEIELELGRHAAVVPELVRLVAEFPLRERLRYLLILALYRCGRQAEALAAYRDVRRLLVEELGVEPGEQLQRLQDRILRNDPALSASDDGPAPTSPRMPAPAASGGASWRLWLRRIGVAAVPLASFGLTTWIVIGFLATWRRSRVQAGAAAGYFGLLVFAVVTIGTPSLEHGVWGSLGVATIFVAMLGGAAHAAVLVPGPRQAAGLWEAQRRLLRQQARQVVDQHPSVARDLRIGRPDLPRQYDDGGLVDLNDAPADVLARLPGITPLLAALIVADRERRGRFVGVDDLVSRGLLPPPIPTTLTELLIVIP